MNKMNNGISLKYNSTIYYNKLFGITFNLFNFLKASDRLTGKFLLKVREGDQKRIKRVDY